MHCRDAPLGPLRCSDWHCMPAIPLCPQMLALSARLNDPSGSVRYPVEINAAMPSGGLPAAATAGLATEIAEAAVSELKGPSGRVLVPFATRHRGGCQPLGMNARADAHTSGAAHPHTHVRTGPLCEHEPIWLHLCSAFLRLLRVAAAAKAAPMPHD